MADEVLYEVADGIATLTLNRPERRNAVTVGLLRRLRSAIAAADSDPGVRVLVLTGSANDFCVGRDQAGDPSTRVMLGVSPEEDRGRLLEVAGVVEALVRSSKPSLAVIRGGCAGAGLSLALACDLRYAADSAVLNTAFVGAGMSGDLGMAWLLTRVVGSAQARELLLLSQKVGAAEAAARGLVHEVVGSEELAARAAAVARRLADSAPLAVAGARQNLESALERELPEFLEVEADRIVVCAYSADAEEARVAFLEKRAPEYTGR